MNSSKKHGEPQMVDVTIESLLQMVIDRSEELFRQDTGLLIPLAYTLRMTLGALVCTDGIPWRINESGEVELMGIYRGTGPFTGRLCYVGGIIAKYEKMADALHRHFKDDLGVEIEMPDTPSFVCEYAKDKPGWNSEPSKHHNIGLTFLVKLKSEKFHFGTTSHGGQEARKILWFSEKNMPADKEFGYDMHIGYKKAFEILKAQQ